MVIETLKTKPQYAMDNIPFNGSWLTFDFPTLVERMKLSHKWTKGELNAMILLKSTDKQMVLTALHEDTEIRSFQSNDSVSFQIIEGRLKFHAGKESVTVDKGQMLTLHEKIKYKLTARAETVFLLTIADRNLQLA